jgi:hypothetical protein
VGRSSFLPLENNSSFKSAGILLLDAANRAAKLSKVPLPLAAVIQVRVEDTAPERVPLRQSFAPVVGKRRPYRLRPAAIVPSIARTAIARNRVVEAEVAGAATAAAVALASGADIDCMHPCSRALAPNLADFLFTASLANFLAQRCDACCL